MTSKQDSEDENLMTIEFNKKKLADILEMNFDNFSMETLANKLPLNLDCIVEGDIAIEMQYESLADYAVPFGDDV